MLKPGDLVLCWALFRRYSFAQFLEVARDAGFRGVTYGLDAYRDARKSGLTDRNIRSMVEDHGLEIEYVDGLLYWLPGAPKPPKTIGAGVRVETEVDKFFEVANAVGARMVNAVTVFDYNPGIEAIAAAFSSLCEKALPLRMSLEFTPFGAVRNLRTAKAILDRVPQLNAGILLDTWHFARSDSEIADIEAVSPERYFAIQVSDTTDSRNPDLFEETLHSRLLPGRGTAEVAKILLALWEHGVRLPYDAEVFSDELLAKCPLEAAIEMAAAINLVAPGA